MPVFTFVTRASSGVVARRQYFTFFMIFVVVIFNPSRIFLKFLEQLDQTKVDDKIASLYCVYAFYFHVNIPYRRSNTMFESAQKGIYK